MIVETKGSFMLRSSYSGDEVAFNRPSLVHECGFIQEKIAQGLLTMHARDLPVTASDREWADWLQHCDGRVSFAVESFVAKFAPQAPEPEPPPALVKKKS